MMLNVTSCQIKQNKDIKHIADAAQSPRSQHGQTPLSPSLNPH